MSDWEAISGVPEFSASLPQRVVVTERVRDRREPADDLELDEELKDTRRIIRSTTPWVFFICIAMYVFTALMFFSFIAGVIVGSKLQSGAIIAQAVINLLFSGVILTGAIFLNHYSAAGSRFVSKKNVADLNVSMRWLGRFWLFTGIVLIFCLTITLIMVIYMIAIGADLSTYSPWVP